MNTARETMLEGMSLAKVLALVIAMEDGFLAPASFEAPVKTRSDLPTVPPAKRH